MGLPRQLTGTDRAKRAAARVVAEAKNSGLGRVRGDHGEDYWSASKRFWQNCPAPQEGRKQYFTNTVYSGGGELLTSTGDVIGRWRNTLRISSIPLTRLPLRKQRWRTQGLTRPLPQAEVTEVVCKLCSGRASGWMRSALSTSSPWMWWGCLGLTRLCNIAMEVGDSASGLGKKGWWSPFLRRGTGGCVSNYRGSHSSASRKSLCQGTGEENLADGRTSDSGGTMRFFVRAVKHWTSSIPSLGCSRVRGSSPDKSTCVLWTGECVLLCPL